MDVDATLDFDAVYNQHHRAVYKYCLKVLKNTHDADDITQNVFTLFYRKKDRLTDDNILGWLIGAAKYEIKSFWHYQHYRTKCDARKWRDGAYREKREGFEPDAPLNDNLMAQTDAVNDRIAIIEALQRMKPSERELIILHDLYGFRHAELVQMTGLKRSNIYNRLDRGRLQMQKQFA